MVRLSIPSYSGLNGEYFLFVYLLEKTAAKKSLQLVPILVSALDVDPYFYDEKTDMILGKLVGGRDLEDDFPFPVQNIGAAEEAADNCIAWIREEEEKKTASRKRSAFEQSDRQRKSGTRTQGEPNSPDYTKVEPEWRTRRKNLASP